MCFKKDTGYWILDTGYWILDTGYWILDTCLPGLGHRYGRQAGCWMLDMKPSETI
jgi:hypothetical protein